MRFLSDICLLAALVVWAARAEPAPSEHEADQRDFLEKTIERLSAKSLKSLVMLDKSTLEEKLARESTRLTGESREREAHLLDELREHLFASLDPKVECELIECKEHEHDQEHLRPKSGDKFARLYPTTGEPEESTRTSELYKLLSARQAKRLELCKPLWDERLLEAASSSFSPDQQVAGASLYSSLATYVPSYRADQPPGYEDAMVLERAPPKPAALVLYLSRKSASSQLLHLDENMKNSHLSRPDYAEAIRAGLKPLCDSVNESQLHSMGPLYQELLQPHDNPDHHQTWPLVDAALERRELYSRQPLEVTRWLVVESACRQLMVPAGDRIVRDIYREITKPAEEFRLEETDVLNADYALPNHAGEEEEFVAQRHRNFMRENGYKIK